MKHLWTGRLDGALDPQAAALNASLSFDRRLAQQDVRGSIAWAHALANAGILTTDEGAQLERGLAKVGGELADGSFAFVPGEEDIHTAVERRLTELEGEVAGKLHTGRSRNDQVATDFRLWTMDAAGRILRLLAELQTALVDRAEKDRGVILPGYTHTQRAQPIALSHWWLAHFWALARDAERVRAARARAAVCPLGSGALAGTAFPVDRESLARELGFSAASENSLDAVGDRDFAAEFLFGAALLGTHLSRMADALILYSTAEFGFIELDDAFSTGSSLMPQKKNADLLELTRAKSGRLLGLLTGLLAVLKGLPSAYDKDLQEDKLPVFEAADTLEAVLPVVRGIVASLAVDADRMRSAIDDGMLATDLADFLVQKGIPFRQAHAAAGKAVRRALELGVSLSQMPRGEFRSIHPGFDADLTEIFNVETAVARRNTRGGTAPASIEEQLKSARRLLAERL
jgi:argininosuccinate lyase